MFLSQLVRLRGKHFYEGFRELQALNVRFSLNYTPVATTGFWRFMHQSLSKYMGIILPPRTQGNFDYGGNLLYNVRIVHWSALTWYTVQL